MVSGSKVYIAGVGFSSSPSDSRHDSALVLISAATKALLDAGVTYDDVTKGVRSKDLKQGCQAFKAFNDEAVTVDGVEGGSELSSSFSQVKNQDAQCVLVITAEKSGAVALLLVSENFIWRRPYLKDSALHIQESASSSEQKVQETLHGICQAAWALRGWSGAQGTAEKLTGLHYKGQSGQQFELSRADAKPIPEWKDTEHRQDGKHRFRYNPATETRDICLEDFEAVRASGKQQTGEDSKTNFKRKGGDRASLARL